MLMRWKRWSLLLPTVFLLAGCYHYVPAASLGHPQGTPIRAHLDSLFSFELAAITVNNIDRVEGEMVRLDSGDMVLSATWLQAITGNGFDGNGWTVRIPETNVTSLELRQFSWWRTGVVLGGIVAGTWLGFNSLGFGPFGSGSGGGGPPIN